MSEKGRRRKKAEKEGEVAEPKRQRARKSKKEEEKVIEPLEEHAEKEGKKWYIISLDFIKVLYSPVKTFKRITENPDIKGPISILALVILVLAGYVYASDLKIFPENFVLNLSLIPSSGPPYNITEGFINPTAHARISVFTFNWTGIVTIYGTNATGGQVSESIIVSKEVLPPNSTIPYHTTEAFATVSKITFDSPGDERSKYVILGMDPREYNSGTIYALGQITQYSISMGINFIINWALYGGILLFSLRIFRQEVESWSALFIVIGYSLAVMIIDILARALLILMIPETKLPLEVYGVWYMIPPEASTENAKAIANTLMDQINQEAGIYSNWPYQILASNFLGMSSITYASNIWMVALWVVALRSYYGLNWKKATTISVIAYISEFLLRIFIGFPWELMVIGVMVLLIKYVFK